MIFLPQKTPVEFLIIEDFFTKTEQSSIWKELQFLTVPRKLLAPDLTDAAKTNGSQKIRKNKFPKGVKLNGRRLFKTTEIEEYLQSLNIQSKVTV
jgi:hypothetical protein